MGHKVWGNRTLCRLQFCGSEESGGSISPPRAWGKMIDGEWGQSGCE